MDVLSQNIRMCFIVLVLLNAVGISFAVKKTYVRGSERLHPPLDIELETINCTAVRVKWWIPLRHISTVTGYKVFYTEMRNGRPASSAVAVNVRLSLDVLAAVKFNGHTIFCRCVWMGRRGTTQRATESQHLPTRDVHAPLGPLTTSRECSASVCEGVTCANEGTCFASHADGYICLCALGYRGPLCQESFQLVVPYFNASVLSYASAPWPRSSRHYLSWMEFEVTFRPTAPDGILLYSQDSASRDFLSISLLGGYLEFSFDCGSGTATIRSEETLTMNEWHELRVSRTGREGILQVDNQMPTHSLGEGAFTQIRCSGPLYIGGVPEHTNPRTKINAGAALLHHFTGSIQKITLNERSIRLPQDFSEGVNMENSLHPCVDSPCANRGTCRPKQALYECDCPLGYTGKHCLQVTEATETPQFIGRSYLVYNNKDILKRVSGCRTNVLLRFRSSAQDGLLLWRGHTPVRANSDFVSLGLEDGALIFSYNLGSGVAIVMINGTFSDGQWHQVKAVRDGQYGSLTVDHYETSTGRSPGNMRQLNTNSMVYLGGMKEVGLYTHGQYLWGLVGCISQLTLSTDYHLSLVEDAAAGKNINTCRP